MCLALIGQVIHVEQNAVGLTMGQVCFDGVVQDICLAYVPDVRGGDYVVSHFGFATARLDSAEALCTLKSLQELAQQLSEEEPP